MFWKTLLFLVAALGIANFGHAADQSARANAAFVEAVKILNSGEPSGEPERFTYYNEINKLLTSIVDDYPESDLAVKLIIGETIGPIDWEAIRSKVEYYSPEQRQQRAEQRAQADRKLAEFLKTLKGRWRGEMFKLALGRVNFDVVVERVNNENGQIHGYLTPTSFETFGIARAQDLTTHLPIDQKRHSRFVATVSRDDWSMIMDVETGFSMQFNYKAEERVFLSEYFGSAVQAAFKVDKSVPASTAGGRFELDRAFRSVSDMIGSSSFRGSKNIFRYIQVKDARMELSSPIPWGRLKFRNERDNVFALRGGFGGADQLLIKTAPEANTLACALFLYDGTSGYEDRLADYAFLGRHHDFPNGRLWADERTFFFVGKSDELVFSVLGNRGGC